MSKLSMRIRQARKAKGYSQTVLGAQLGISQQHVAKWENDENSPDTPQITRLAQALDCTTDWLLGLVDVPQAHIVGNDLTSDERQLLDLYRRGELPTLVERLITEMGGRQSQENAIEHSSRQSDIP